MVSITLTKKTLSKADKDGTDCSICHEIPEARMEHVAIAVEIPGMTNTHWPF